MNNFYRQYYILRSLNNRHKSVVIKVEDKEAYISLSLNFDNREQHTSNLYLIGLDKHGKQSLKKEVLKNERIRISKNEKDITNLLLIVYEKEKDIKLSYLEKEKEETSFKYFEKYRFDNLTKMPIKPSRQSMHEKTQTKQRDETYSEPKKENPSNQMGNDMSGMLKSFQQATAMFSKMNQSQSEKEPTKGEHEKTFSGKKEETINPFKRTFPNSKWIKTQYESRSGFWHYISGKIYQDNEVKYKAIGVPGEYSMTPPSWLEGFNKYYISDLPIAKGYWVMFLDPECGTVIDIDKIN